MQKILLIFLFLISFNAFAENDPISLEADVIEYDAGNNETITKASGNVIVIQNQNTLIADKITYFALQDKMLAEGNITLTNEDGTKILSEKLELTDKLKKGIIYAFKLRFPDNSYLEASIGEKENENTYKLENAMYTPCSFICGKTKPMWSIKSRKTIFNKEKEKISYNNAFFNIYDIPVFYTPYLSHPTPKAKRKSGFLVPYTLNSTYLGKTVTVPYYYNIAPNKDLTIESRYSYRRGLIMLGSYRHLLQTGKYEANFSATKRSNNTDDRSANNPKINELRGHLVSKGSFQHQNSWNSGFDLNLTTDKTYLENYQLKNKTNEHLNTLTSNVYINNYQEKSFFKLDNLYFQNLQEDRGLNQTSRALPLTEYYFETDKFNNNSVISNNSNFLSLIRKQDFNVNRFSNVISWKLPISLDNGHLFSFSNNLRSDIYQYTNSSNQTYMGNKSRFVPSSEIIWNYPLTKDFEESNLIIEPISSIILAPSKNYNTNIYNEDSQYVELSDSNLFASNRASGFDQIEYGSRANYGIKTSFYSLNNITMDSMIGQSYMVQDFANDNSYSTGFYPNYSDIVGRANLNYKGKTELAYRFTMNKTKHNLAKQEIGLKQNWRNYSIKVEYFGLNDGIPYQGITNRKEIYLEGNSNYNRWTFAFNLRKNLTKRSNYANPEDSKGPRIKSVGSGLIYKGDCTSHSFTFERKYTRSTGIKASNTWMYKLELKTLGSWDVN